MQKPVIAMSHGKRFRQKLHQFVYPANSPCFMPGNQVTLLQSGDDYFPAIEAALDRAQHEIYLETYIYENDATGRRVADALKRAARRGVTVYMLIDGYGSSDLPRSMLDYLRADGVKVLIYRPRISPWTFRRERLRRLHRKIVVVDREIAFVGGLNIINDHEPTGDVSSRYDYAVAVEGPLVEAIRLSARRLWSMTAWSYFRKGVVHTGAPPASGFTGGEMNAAFLVRDNFRHRREIEAEYLRAIEQASAEIILAHAYFLPGYDFRQALIKAAQRGVRVILLLQGRVEYFIQHYASRALYGDLLATGIEIYEYHTSFLHAKVAVIDRHWATVGSSNIDPFSLLLSREANIVVDDAKFAEMLSTSLMQTVETEGRRILRDNWQHQSARVRVMSWLSYGLLRFMMGISGYASDNIRIRDK